MRNIFTVNAKQIVISEQNPQGVLSNVSGYPVDFDSRFYKATASNPNGDEGIALLAAQANYASEIVTLATAENANRVGWSVFIIRASDGKQIANKSEGAFPDMTPAPQNNTEPTPASQNNSEPTEEPESEQEEPEE